MSNMIYFFRLYLSFLSRHLLEMTRRQNIFWRNLLWQIRMCRLLQNSKWKPKTPKMESLHLGSRFRFQAMNWPKSSWVWVKRVANGFLPATTFSLWIPIFGIWHFLSLACFCTKWAKQAPLVKLLGESFLIFYNQNIFQIFKIYFGF